MNKYLQELKDNGLVPLRLDNNTVLFVPPEKANRKYKDKYLKNAEKLNAQAEIERAKGAAEAIRIENGSITPTYIQYLWVRQQNNAPNKVVYIPTEANLPILEAKK